MKIIHFMKYLVFQIIFLCNNGYSVNTTCVHSNDTIASYKLLGNMRVLVPDEHSYHRIFPDLIMRCYTKPSKASNFSLYVRKSLLDPNSQNIKVNVQDGVFSLQDDDVELPNFGECGIIKFNNKYYLACYELIEEINEYHWWYLDSFNDLWWYLGTTPAF